MRQLGMQRLVLAWLQPAQRGISPRPEGLKMTQGSLSRSAKKNMICPLVSEGGAFKFKDPPTSKAAKNSSSGASPNGAPPHPPESPESALPIPALLLEALTTSRNLNRGSNHHFAFHLHPTSPHLTFCPPQLPAFSSPASTLILPLNHAR